MQQHTVPGDRAPDMPGDGARDMSGDRAGEGTGREAAGGHIGDGRRGTVSRREAVLLGTGAVGLTGVLAACGGGSGGGAGGYGGAPGTEGTSGGGGASGEVLGQAGEIPVGGGKIFSEQKVVVTQPEQGTFKAFSAVCTHQGCTVGTVSDGIIQCPCHGSRFSAEDGSVQGGPASKPLPPEQISVRGGEITLA